MKSPLTRPELSVLSVCFLVAIAAGCSTAPNAPSGIAGSGAVIAGAVTGSQSSGLTVRVSGTNLSAVVDSTGAFEMADVPPGTARLQFTGGGVNASAEIRDVKVDQFVALQVQVNGAEAVVVSDARSRKVSLCHAEGNGSYHLINVSESAEPAHRAHGDGMIGDPVPGRPSQVFDAACRPTGPSIDIEKFTNGEDADSAPGPRILVGSDITWTYRVTNTGTVSLTGIVVTDDQGVSVVCVTQGTFAPGASMTCTGTGEAELGPYRNVGTVTANWTVGPSSGQVTDSDASHYLGVLSLDDDDGPKVTLCHRTPNGSFHSITVSVNAEPAHIKHGDGKPGGPVPNQPGKIFGPNCSIQ